MWNPERLGLVAGTRRSRLAALALLLVPLLLLAVLLGSVITARVSGPSLDDLRNRAAQLSRMSERRPALEEQRAALVAAQAQSPDFLRGSTPALVLADMQSRIGGLIRAQGGRVDSTQGLPEQTENGFRRVTVRIHMAASIVAVRGIFYAIESGTPRLQIGGLAIRAPVPGGDGLDVDFDVYGYMMDDAQ